MRVAAQQFIQTTNLAIGSETLTNRSDGVVEFDGRISHLHAMPSAVSGWIIPEQDIAMPGTAKNIHVVAVIRSTRRVMLMGMFIFAERPVRGDTNRFSTPRNQENIICTFILEKDFAHRGKTLGHPGLKLPTINSGTASERIRAGCVATTGIRARSGAKCNNERS